MAPTRSTIELLFSGSSADAVEAIRRLRRSLAGLDDDKNKINKTAAGLESVFKGSTKALFGLGALGNAVPAVAALTTSVTTAAGALLILPAAGIGAAAAIGTLKIATKGFGDAVKASDPAAFAAATKDMAPNAVATAKAFRDLNPQVKALRQEVQSKFFQGFAGDAKLLGNTYLPVLKPQLAGIATEFNGMGREAAKALIAPGAVGDLNTVLGNTRTQVGDLRPALANVLDGVLAIAGQGSNAFGNFGLQITDATARFRQWATQAAETGRITELIQRGKEELSKYGDVASNVGGILGAVFRGLSAGGLDFTGNLVKSTQALEDFLNTAEGQGVLESLGKTLQVTGDVVRTVLLVALKELGPVIVAAAPAVQEFARALGELLVDALQTVGPLLEGLAGFISDNASGIQNFLPILAGLYLGFKALAIIQSVVGWVQAASAAFGLTLGPIGALITVLGLVAAAVAVFVLGEDDAADAAQRHQDAVDKLIGTLVPYSGALTQATRDQIANELASKKLADGTTKVTDALSAAGISFADYSAAAAGNEGALQKVNAQLLTGAKDVISHSDAYAAGSKTLDKYGISLDLLSAAALGNTQAQDQIAKKFETTAKNSEAAKNQAADLTERYREAIGPLGELGSTLGGYSGALKDARDQAQLAGQASLDFKDILGAVGASLATLADGSKPLPPLVKGFQDLGLAASNSAKAAGEAAFAYGGVQGGADAASRSMQESRRSFTDAAKAAGLTVEQADALANQIGLIPEAASTKFTTNADETTGQIITLKEQFDAVPNAKSVVVSALTDDAIKQLEALGFKITDLGNNQFEVAMKDDKARASLDKLVADISSTVGFVQMDAKPDLATGKVNAWVKLADGTVGTATMDANGNPAEIQLGKTKYKIDNTTGVLTVDGNVDPAEKDRSGMKIAIDKTTGTIIFLANDSAVVSAKDRAKQPTSSTHTIHVIVQGAAAAGAALGLRGAGGMLVGKSTMAMTRDGVGFSGGGFILGGYAPGRDTVGPLWLSPGEAVLVPELVRQLGPANILRANLLASGGRAATIAGSWPGFAGGGLVTTPSSRAYLSAQSGTTSTVGTPTAPATVIVAPPAVGVRVFVDGQEFRGLVRSEIDSQDRATARRARTGRGVTF